MDFRIEVGLWMDARNHRTPEQGGQQEALHGPDC